MTKNTAPTWHASVYRCTQVPSEKVKRPRRAKPTAVCGFCATSVAKSSALTNRVRLISSQLLVTKAGRCITHEAHAQRTASHPRDCDRTNKVASFAFATNPTGLH